MVKIIQPSIYQAAPEEIRLYAQTNGLEIRVLMLAESVAVAIDKQDKWAGFFEAVRRNDQLFQRITLCGVYTRYQTRQALNKAIEEAELGDFADLQKKYINPYLFFRHHVTLDSSSFGYVTRRVLTTLMRLFGCHQNKITLVDEMEGQEYSVAKAQGHRALRAPDFSDLTQVSPFLEKILEHMGASVNAILERTWYFNLSST